MDPVTTRVDSDTKEQIEARAEEHGATQSEVARELIRKGLEYDDRVEKLQAERDDLRRQLREANRRNDDVDEIVAYVEEERTLQRRQAEREREREEAGVLTRGKWWLFGRDLDDWGGEDGS